MTDEDFRYDYFCWAPSTEHLEHIVAAVKEMCGLRLKAKTRDPLHDDGWLVTFSGPVPYRDTSLARHDMFQRLCDEHECWFDGSGVSPNDLRADEVPEIGLSRAQYVVQQEALRAGMKHDDATTYAKETVS